MPQDFQLQLIFSLTMRMRRLMLLFWTVKLTLPRILSHRILHVKIIQFMNAMKPQQQEL